MTLRVPFRLQLAGPIFASLPVGSLQSTGAPIDLTPDVSALEWTTGLPGGYLSARIGLNLPDARRRRRERPNLDWLRPFGDVKIVAARGALATVFRGRLIQPRYVGGWPETLTVVGYGAPGAGSGSGLDDQAYVGSTSTASTSGTVLIDVLTRCCPTLTVGTIVDPGIAHTHADYDAQMPTQIVQAMTQEGGVAFSGAAASLWDFLAYRESVTGALYADFLPRIAPQQAQYRIPIDATVAWDDDFSQAYGGCNVRYTASGGSSAALSAAALSTLFTNTFGITRNVIIAGGQMTAAGANALAAAYASFHQLGVPKITVTRTAERGLETVGGAERPAYLVRAGEWADFGDPTDNPTVQASLARGPFICTETHYDATSGVGTFTFNAAPRDEIHFLFTLHQIAQSVVQQSVPLTGARMVGT